MKYVALTITLLLSSNAIALEQYWFEEKNGVRHACYSPGFWAMIGGNRTCSAFNGDTPPDRNALRVAATAPAEEKANYAAVSQRITATRNERAAIEKNTKEIERTIENLNRTPHPCTERSFQAQEDCLKRHQSSINELHTKLASERARLSEAQKETRVLDTHLEREASKARPTEERARLANQIIANKDVLDRLDRLNGRLTSSSETLAAVERAFSRTLLEAYVYQKMQKMAANLCQAQQQCSSNPSEAQKKLLDGVFDSAQIESDAKSSRSNSSAP